MKLTFKHAVIAAVILLVAAGAMYLPGRGKLVETVAVSQGPMVQTVVMSGRIATVARVDIAAQTTARIESVLVREGEPVKAGQVLVRLRDDEAQAALAQARAAVTQSRAQLRELQTIQGPVSDQLLEQARANHLQAQNELERAQDLLRQGFVSQSRVDDATRLANASAAALRAAHAQALGNRADGATALLAQARLDQALASQQAAAARLDQLSLRAPADAVVIVRSADPGDTAQSGKALLTLVSGDETRIHASVDEKNLKYLRLGQSAAGVADAYADRKFAARLSYIAPAVDAQRGTLDVRLVVEPVPDFLRPDMTVSVEVVTAQRDSTLMLPSDALRKGADGLPYVLVSRDGKAQQVSVRTGLLGTGATEITQGLGAGERVILPSSVVAAGDAVRDGH
jgi:HlyD family secretion protein